MTALEEDRAGAGVVSTPVALLMALIGVFAFSALAVLLSFGQDLKGGDNGQAQVLSRSAIGFAGPGARGRD